MLEKKERLIITFPTTTEAIKMEKVCMEQGQLGRLIPIPGEISAGCGLCWRADPADRSSLEETMETHSVTWEKIVLYTM